MRKLHIPNLCSLPITIIVCGGRQKHELIANRKDTYTSCSLTSQTNLKRPAIIVFFLKKKAVSTDSQADSIIKNISAALLLEFNTSYWNELFIIMCLIVH